MGLTGKGINGITITIAIALSSKASLGQTDVAGTSKPKTSIGTVFRVIHRGSGEMNGKANPSQAHIAESNININITLIRIAIAVSRRDYLIIIGNMGTSDPIRGMNIAFMTINAEPKKVYDRTMALEIAPSSYPR